MPGGLSAIPAKEETQRCGDRRCRRGESRLARPADGREPGAHPNKPTNDKSGADSY